MGMVVFGMADVEILPYGIGCKDLEREYGNESFIHAQYHDRQCLNFCAQISTRGTRLPGARSRPK